MVIQWWCDFEVLYQILIYQFQKIIINIKLRFYPIIFMSKNPHFMLYQSKGPNFNIHHYKKSIVYKMAMGKFFYKFQKIITFERSKQQKIALYRGST